MVKVDKNTKIDFYNQEWVSLLDQAAYRGYHVSDLLSAIEKAEAKGEPIAIGYKSTAKAIHLTFGKHKLKLERIVKKKTPFTFSRLWHQIKMGCSQSYADKHQARIERLAGLIQDKLKLDKSGEEIPLVKAITEGDLAKFQELINSGVNVNITDKDGRTPLMFAAWAKQSEMAHALLEAGAHVNGIKDNFGSTPLMFAAQSGNMDLVSRMLFKDAEINEQNKKGVTPLLYAIDSGNLMLVSKLIEMGADMNVRTDMGSPLLNAIAEGNIQMVQKLIEMGADVNEQTDQQISPLLCAVKLGNIQMVQKLIDLGANPLLQDLKQEGITVVEKLKYEFRKENTKEILVPIYAKAPDLKIRNKELKYRKQLAHAWHLQGKTNLPIQNIPSEVLLEGAMEPLWFHQMTKHLEKFSTLYPAKSEIATLLRSAFEWAKYQHDYSDEQIAERIQLGLPTFLFAGFRVHSVVLFIWKDQVVICDRGGYSHNPVKIQTFDPESFTADTVEKIRSLQSGEEEDHRQFIHEELPIQIKSTQTELDTALEEATELAMQSVGNCSWVSSITAIYAMLLLSGVRGEADEQLLGEPVSEAVRIERIQKSVDDYRTWIGFQQLESIEQMMKLIPEGKSTFAPDHDLIQRAFEKAHLTGFDAVLSEKLAASTEVYLASLQEPEKSAFRNKLQEWQARRELDPLPIIL